MKDRKYKSYIYFSKHCLGEIGRKIFIAPTLLLKFAECAEPHTDSGTLIAQNMVSQLRSDSDGLRAAKDVRNPKGHYMDFGQAANQRIRVYYEIFQDDGGGTNRGPGLYIYDLKKLNKHDANDRPGLYDAKFSQGQNKWLTRIKINEEFDQNKVVIGAHHMDGVYNITHTTKTVSNNLPGDMDNYNLYYSPDYLIDNDSQWETPAKRINTSTGKHELATLLKKSNAWDTKKHDNVTTHVFGESAKLLIEALEIVKNDGIQLTRHTFKFYSPSASFAKLKQAVESSGGKLGANWDSVKPNAISMLYQETDAKNIESMYMNQSFERIQATKGRTGMLLEKYHTRENILSNPNALFFDLWQATPKQ
jgi:hypothetical protein